MLKISDMIVFRSGFKASDQVQGQGVPRIENGAYTLVREYFNPRGNAAIGPQMGF
jgi:hypothetical protein